MILLVVLICRSPKRTIKSLIRIGIGKRAPSLGEIGEWWTRSSPGGDSHFFHRSRIPARRRHWEKLALLRRNWRMPAEADSELAGGTRPKVSGKLPLGLAILGPRKRGWRPDEGRR